MTLKLKLHDFCTDTRLFKSSPISKALSCLKIYCTHKNGSFVKETDIYRLLNVYRKIFGTSSYGEDARACECISAI